MSGGSTTNHTAGEPLLGPRLQNLLFRPRTAAITADPPCAHGQAAHVSGVSGYSSPGRQCAGSGSESARERRTRKTSGKISSRLSTASSKSLLASSVRTGAAFVKSMRAGAAFVTSSKFACGEEHRRGKACGRARVPSVRAAHGTQRASARVTARTLIDPDGGRCGARRRGARRAI